MTSPVRSFSTNYGRFYTHPSSNSSTESVLGRLVQEDIVSSSHNGPYDPKPSITNIISVINEGFLPGYYAKLVAEYAVHNLDEVSGNIEKFGPEVAIGSLKAVVNKQHPAASIGDEVHNAIDQWVQQGEIPEFTTTTARQMFQQFLNFIQIRDPEVIRSEYTVWSYKHGYAGTGDLLWYDQGKMCIVDTKTGSAVRPKVALQLAAIANADIILESDGSEIELQGPFDLYALHVRPRSVKLHKIQGAEQAWETFLAAKRIFDWKRFDHDNHLLEPFKTEKSKS